MRVGINPMRGFPGTPMPPVIGCVITHLPNQDGYHEQRMAIIQFCLNSMRHNAGADLPVYVWDNGSCPEFREWLLNDYKPEFVTLAPNVGKASARSSIVRTWPATTAVCMSDDDMFFYEDWLQPQLDLLHGFPNVGIVSGYPVRTQFRWGNRSTIKWAQENATITKGRFIPDEWERDFCASVGRDYAEHAENTKDEQDILIEYKGLKAYATGHHCQFITLAGNIDYIVQYDGEAISNERLFDTAIDSEGWLRLTTTRRLVRHMGNVLDPEFQGLATVNQ